MDEKLTNCVIIYNNGKGKITCNLEKFFERSPKGRFLYTNKQKAFKLLELYFQNKPISETIYLINWLKKNRCEDIANKFIEKHPIANGEYL